jgi:hypothetical protein
VGWKQSDGINRLSEEYIASMFMVEKYAKRETEGSRAHLHLFFDSKYKGNVMLRNVGWLWFDYATIHFRRQNFIATAVRTNACMASGLHSARLCAA